MAGDTDVGIFVSDCYQSTVASAALEPTLLVLRSCGQFKSWTETGHEGSLLKLCENGTS